MKLKSVVMAVCLCSASLMAQPAERYVVLDGTSGLARIFNASDNAQVATLPTGPTPNSIVFSPDGKRAFVANLNGQYLSVLDLTIQAEIKRIRPSRIDQVATSPDGKILVGTHVDDESVTVFDATTLNVIRQVSLNGLAGDDPNSFDLSFNNPVIFGNKLYLNTSADIVAVDLQTSAVTPLSGPNDFFFFQSAENLAITPDGKTLAAIRSAGLVLIDTASGSTVTTTPFDFAVSVTSGVSPVNPALTVAYVVNFNFSLPGLVLDLVDLQAGSPGFGKILAEIPLPAGVPLGQQTMITLNPSGTTAYISGSNGNPNLVVIDTGAAVTNPGAAIVHQSVIGLQNRGVGVAITQTQPSASAPTVTEVNKNHVKNDKAEEIRVTGTGFVPGAMVRLGTLDPVPADVVSSTVLRATVPDNAASQNAAIIVTNPSLDSGILRDALAIDAPEQFNPPFQAIAVNFGSSSISISDPINDRGLAALFPTGPRSLQSAISPDGQRAYVTNLFQPASIDVFNLATDTVEAHIVLNGIAASLLGQEKGLVLAPRPGSGKLAAYVLASRRRGRGFAVDLYVIDADPSSPTLDSIVQVVPVVVNTAQLANGSLAVTPDGLFAFMDEQTLTGAHNFIVVDLTSQAVTTTPLVNLGVSTFQLDMELSPDGKFIFLSGDDGSLRVFDVATNPTAPALVTVLHGTAPAGTNSVVLNSPRVVGGHLFSLDTFNNVVNIFNFNPAAGDFSELANFAVPGPVAAIEAAGEVTADGKLIYFPLREEDSLAVLDVDKILNHDPNALITKIGTGVAPDWVSIRPGITGNH